MRGRSQVVGAGAIAAFLVCAGCGSSSGAGSSSAPTAACSLLTPELATSAIGTSIERGAGSPTDTCVYSSDDGGSAEGISLLLYYGQSAVKAFESGLDNVGSVVSAAGIPASQLSYRKISVDNRAAYWSPATTGGSLVAVDNSYVLHVDVVTGADAEEIAQDALGRIEAKI